MTPIYAAISPPICSVYTFDPRFHCLTCSYLGLQPILFSIHFISVADTLPFAIANPPSLPPTVEEAYRRKCIQLKERYKEIEDENDAYRLRLTRLKRQIQKTRLERAILLEQIAKRTSTNVEDSEGSPSPPPTVRIAHLKCIHLYSPAFS